jgi:enterochelin esterase-like enzyme
MGGAAAAVHAFRQPSRFCAVGIHSPALFTGPPENGGPPWIFGIDGESFAARNPAHLARNLNNGLQPRIYLDTGDQDMMRDVVEHLHQTLIDLDVEHQYCVEPGPHNKTYWEPRMARYLAFYARDWTM